jgi:pyrophosphatase PpaX
MFKYILLDFDGTLANTNELIKLALKETSNKFLGRDLTEEEFVHVFGRYLEEQMKFLSKSKYSEMEQFYRAFYNENKDGMTKEITGVKAMLHRLKDLDCKIAIVSAKGRSGIEHGIKLLGIVQYIDVIISANDVENNKPDAEPALKALAALGGNAENAIIVGDSPHDILCGKNAGVKTVLVDWSIFPKEETLKHKPDYIIKTPDELIDIVRNSMGYN